MIDEVPKIAGNTLTHSSLTFPEKPEFKLCVSADTIFYESVFI